MRQTERMRERLRAIWISQPFFSHWLSLLMCRRAHFYSRRRSESFLSLIITFLSQREREKVEEE